MILRGLIAGCLALIPALAVAQCSQDRIDLRGDWGTARFTVEIADDPKERARGLMCREEMAQGAGMLFIFERAHRARFWMKNTLIPLDMIFIRPNGEIQTVHDSAIPGDLSGVDGGRGILYVLEINGGLSARLGLKPGDVIRHPAIPSEIALWPCP